MTRHTVGKPDIDVPDLSYEISMTMDNSKRGVPRQRILKAGKIIMTGGLGSHNCVIKNTSSDGARIEL